MSEEQRKNVLFIDLTGHNPLPPESVLRVAAHKCEVTSVTSGSSALANITSTKLDAIVCNSPDLEIFEAVRKHQKKAQTVLVTEAPMSTYSDSLKGKEADLIDHIIADHNSQRWLTNELRITIQKIVQEDYFGIEKYLPLDSEIKKIVVTNTKGREIYNQEIMKYAEKFRVGNHSAKTIYGISEELLMNALFDAPEAAGVKLSDSLEPRVDAIELKPEHYVELKYAYGGDTFGISVTDQFGSIKKDTFLKYLGKVLHRDDMGTLIDTKKGGAGLGLFKIMYGCHSLICNVESGKKTEMIALIDLKTQLRDFSKMPRSIFFFDQ